MFLFCLDPSIIFTRRKNRYLKHNPMTASSSTSNSLLNTPPDSSNIINLYPYAVPENLLQVHLAGTLEFLCGYEECEDKGKRNSKKINSSFFQCPICQCVVRCPIEVPCCKHWYCCSCFMEYTRQSIATEGCLVGRMKCAVCRKHFDPASTTNILLISRRIKYNKLIVVCPFNCDRNFPIDEMLAHEQYQCPKRPVCCPFQCCSEITTGADIIKHMDSCPQKCMYCPCCGLRVRFGFENWHNCINDLKHAVKCLNRQLEEANRSISYHFLAGEPGQIAFTPRKDIDIKSPMEAYCQKYNKRQPVRIPIQKPAKNNSAISSKPSKKILKKRGLALINKNIKSKRTQHSTVQTTSTLTIHQDTSNIRAESMTSTSTALRPLPSSNEMNTGDIVSFEVSDDDNLSNVAAHVSNCSLEIIESNDSEQLPTLHSIFSSLRGEATNDTSQI